MNMIGSTDLPRYVSWNGKLGASSALSTQLECRIRDLSDSDGGPFYLYDEAVIREACQCFLAIPYTPKSIHFATMSNASPHILRIVKEEGLSIFVASIAHLELAAELGFQGEEIVFAASAMDDDAMRRVHAHQALVVLDSIGQLNQWHSLFPNTSAGIRCNIGDLVSARPTRGGYFIGKHSRLGLSLQEIDSLKGLPLVDGLHVYVGTDILDSDYFVECYGHVVQLARDFPALRYLDFGGGIGLAHGPTDEFSVTSYGERTASLVRGLSESTGKSIRLILEPGRVIAGRAGYFACRVTDVKARNGLQLVGVNASSVQFPRPLFYPDTAHHPIYILHKVRPFSRSFSRKTGVYGCSTYSRDFLARDVMLPQLEVGDVVVFGHAGAYCAAAHTDFLGFPRAHEYSL